MTTTALAFKGEGNVRWQAPKLLAMAHFEDNESVKTRQDLDVTQYDGLGVEAIKMITNMSDVYAYACVCLEVSHPRFLMVYLSSHFAGIYWSSSVSNTLRRSCSTASCVSK